MTIDLATVLSILSILSVGGTLIGLAVKAGERREATTQMKREIVALKADRDKDRDQSREDGKLLAGIQSTLDALVKSVDEAKAIILQHVGSGQ